MKMKIRTKIIIATAMLFGFNIASAQTVFTSPAVPVASVIPSSAGSVIVGTTGITANDNPAACPNAGFLIDPSVAGARNLYATILTAMASEATVSFGISTAGCMGGFPIIDGLIVTP